MPRDAAQSGLGVIMVAPNGRLFESAVHAFDLDVGPRASLACRRRSRAPRVEWRWNKRRRVPLSICRWGASFAPADSDIKCFYIFFFIISCFIICRVVFS